MSHTAPSTGSTTGDPAAPSLPARILESGRVRPGTVLANGLEFPFLEAGEGPLVLCLHGFPDHPRSWVPLLDRLAAEGYRAVAPTLRGYAPQALPADGVYRSYANGQDVLAIIQALGERQAIVIGHDIGARAAYCAASIDGSRVSKLVGMAVPYGSQVTAAIVTDGDQQRRSWYMYFFQTRMAEMAVKLNDYAFIDRLWREWSPGYVLHPAEAASIKQTLDQPGVLTATMGFYRQLFAAPPTDPALKALEAQANGKIAVDTLYLHGNDDGCMAPTLSDGMETLFTGHFERKLLPGVGHFLHLEQPDAVGDAIVAFMKQERG